MMDSPGMPSTVEIARRKGQLGSSTLKLHLPHPLPNGNLRHFIRIEAEPPIGTRFSGCIILGFIRLHRRLAQPEES